MNRRTNLSRCIPGDAYKWYGCPDAIQAIGQPVVGRVADTLATMEI